MKMHAIVNHTWHLPRYALTTAEQQGYNWQRDECRK